MLDGLPNCPNFCWGWTTCGFSRRKTSGLQVKFDAENLRSFPTVMFVTKNLISISFSCFERWSPIWKKIYHWWNPRKINNMNAHTFGVPRLFPQVFFSSWKMFFFASDVSSNYAKNCWVLKSLVVFVPLMEEIQHHLGWIKHCNEDNMCRDL